MYSAETQIRVRYGETDQMGYVYYGYYAMYYEVGRVESLRQLGVTYREVEESGIMMPVLETHSKFLAPAKYDELLKIKTTIPIRPAARIVFEYELYGEDKKKIHEGLSIRAFVDMKTSRPCRPPRIIMDVLESYFS